MAGKKSPRVRCGECEACKREDCGSCRCCVKFKKFGGHGNCKSACEMRRCTNLKERVPLPTPIVADTIRDPRPGPVQPQPPPSAPTPPPVETSSPQLSPLKKRMPPPPTPFETSMPPLRKKRARKTTESSAETVTAVDATLPHVTHMYGLPVPKRVQEVCAGCLGERNEELKDDGILLCDGEGCGSEYHMACCLPPLTQVPEGKFYCFDCDPHGSTAPLKVYFDNAAEVRASYETSREYVEFLLKQQVLAYEHDGPRTPRSELERISEAMRDIQKGMQGKGSPSRVEVPEKVETLGPEFLVGKPVQLYCPNDNQYHHGRIIDWRRATHLGPISAATLVDEHAFHGTIEIAKCEFLVTFPAGKDYRKTTLRQWLILEEHCMAVVVALIWGELHRKRGIAGWMPAQTWLRTSLELVPVRDCLLEKEGQVFYMDKPPPASSQRIWALTEFLCEPNHALLSLREETMDFSRKSFIKQRLERTASPTKTGTTVPDRCEVAVALAQAEKEEQERVQKWYSMALHNLAHPRALTIADESALPPLLANGQAQVETIPRQCQLIPRGLDRMYILGMLESQGVKISKDVAASMTCEPEESTTGAIRRLQQL